MLSNFIIRSTAALGGAPFRFKKCTALNFAGAGAGAGAASGIGAGAGAASGIGAGAGAASGGASRSALIGGAFLS